MKDIVCESAITRERVDGSVLNPKIVNLYVGGIGTTSNI